MNHTVFAQINIIEKPINVYPANWTVQYVQVIISVITVLLDDISIVYF